MPRHILSPNPGSGSDGCFAALSEILDEEGGTGVWGSGATRRDKVILHQNTLTEAEDAERRQRQEELGRPRTPEPASLGMGSDLFTDAKPTPQYTPSAERLDALNSRLLLLSNQFESFITLTTEGWDKVKTSQSGHDEILSASISAATSAASTVVASAFAARDAQTPAKSDAEKATLEQLMADWKKAVDGQWSSMRVVWSEGQARLIGDGEKRGARWKTKGWSVQTKAEADGDEPWSPAQSSLARARLLHTPRNLPISHSPFSLLRSRRRASTGPRRMVGTVGSRRSGDSAQWTVDCAAVRVRVCVRVSARLWKDGGWLTLWLGAAVNSALRGAVNPGINNKAGGDEQGPAPAAYSQLCSGSRRVPHSSHQSAVSRVSQRLWDSANGLRLRTLGGYNEGGGGVELKHTRLLLRKAHDFGRQ
ncbi:hypothetical protein CCMSSC00406_0009212 [Pleurotus cornucopiae]|uniref:Uncharacterized protein n=1 Tax=Pleurotus cornucopiae TaxID=5321 RepID=A0ACB7IWC2_PLECO|nr:hypothetical protein CCMSSC00406_0009212 [Pleurotus cornucopiae]